MPKDVPRGVKVILSCPVELEPEWAARHRRMLEGSAVIPAKAFIKVLIDGVAECDLRLGESIVVYVGGEFSAQIRRIRPDIYPVFVTVPRSNKNPAFLEWTDNVAGELTEPIMPGSMIELNVHAAVQWKLTAAKWG